MIVTPAYPYIPVAIKSDSLAMTDGVIDQLLSMRVEFEPNPLQVSLW